MQMNRKEQDIGQCLQPYDPASLNRPDIPANVQQLMIVRDSTVLVQGRPYVGEVCVNAVALQDDAQGAIQFIFKSQDLLAMPKQQADLIVELIMEVEYYLPKVQRGKKAAALKGYMKCALERHSCCGGDFGYTKAERSNDDVATKILSIVREEVKALRLAFPHALLGIYSRYDLVEVAFNHTSSHTELECQVCMQGGTSVSDYTKRLNSHTIMCIRMHASKHQTLQYMQVCSCVQRATQHWDGPVV